MANIIARANWQEKKINLVFISSSLCLASLPFMLRSTPTSVQHDLVAYLKKEGKILPASRDACLEQTRILCQDLNQTFVNHADLVQAMFDTLPPKQHTNATLINKHLRDTAHARTLYHPDFSILAGRLLLAQLYSTTSDTFQGCVEYLVAKNPRLLRDEYVDFCLAHGAELETWLEYQHDVCRPYDSLTTECKIYLARADSKEGPAERPQYCLMRAAIDTHLGRVRKGEEPLTVILKEMRETYQALARGQFVFATPILINSGLKNNSKSSCFLIAPPRDDLESQMDYMACKAAHISKSCGGIGFTVDLFRGANSTIHSSGGTTHSIVHYLRIMQAVANNYDQGGGRRKGSFACYVPIWHSDVKMCLDAMRHQGDEKLRCRDLFFGLWICDEFYRRLFFGKTEEERRWSLFSPDDVPGLYNTYGDEFTRLYKSYEAQGLARDTIDSHELFFAILDRLSERGFPYMLNADACNRKNNQSHVGPLRNSNLCTEILQFCGRNSEGQNEISVCNLASISLPAFCIGEWGKSLPPTFSFSEFRRICHLVVRDMNYILDNQEYPVKEAEYSNKRHRPLGIGLQGLQNLFFHLRLPYESKEAQEWNSLLYEHLYFNCLEKSSWLARDYGKPYETYEGSEFSKGNLQFDLWQREIDEKQLPVFPDSKPFVPPPLTCDWKTLKAHIAEYGTYNSLLTTQMPTASTSQRLGNVESMEPIYSIVTRLDTISGEFFIVNRELVELLCEMGIWNKAIAEHINANAGRTIQDLTVIPEEIRRVFKTRFEIKQRSILEHATGRGRFLDQSQSQNYLLPGSVEENHRKLLAIYRTAWEHGHKTASYYVRGTASHNYEQSCAKLVEKMATEKNGSQTKASTSTLQAKEEQDSITATTSTAAASNSISIPTPTTMTCSLRQRSRRLLQKNKFDNQAADDNDDGVGSDDDGPCLACSS